METRKSLFKNPLIIASLGCFMAFAVACGDDDDSGDPAPNGGSKATGGTGGSGGKSSTAGSSGSAGKNSNAGAGNEATGGGDGPGPGPGPGTSGGEGGTGTGSGGAPADCEDESDLGCYSCKPSTLSQFLNACPTTGCEPFDNGSLTSLPSS